jgi:protein-disulfide isomerase
MHDLNFADQSQLDAATLRTRALNLGLTGPTFDRCLAKDAGARVEADQATGRTLGVTGTPTFFIGLRQSDGRVKLVKRLVGALPIDQFSAALDAALKTVATGATK